MSPMKVREYKYKASINTVMLLSSIFTALVGLCLLILSVLFILAQDDFYLAGMVTGIYHLGLSCFLVFGLLWYRGTPYVRLTSDEIIILGGPFAKPKFLQWDSIREVNRPKKNTIELVLLDDERVKMRLSNMEPSQREDFVNALEHYMLEKRPQAG